MQVFLGSGKSSYPQAEKQPDRGVLKRRCSENMQQIYRRAAMLKCNFNKVALKSHFGMGVVL